MKGTKSIAKKPKRDKIAKSIVPSNNDPVLFAAVARSRSEELGATRPPSSTRRNSAGMINRRVSPI